MMCSSCFKEVQGPARDSITEARMIDPSFYEKYADSAEAATEMR
jgi:hypothetical protein